MIHELIPLGDRWYNRAMYKRSKRRLDVRVNGYEEEYLWTHPKRVLTEEAMAASLQELHLSSATPAVVTTTVTVTPYSTPASTLACPFSEGDVCDPCVHDAYRRSGDGITDAGASRHRQKDYMDRESQGAAHMLLNSAGSWESCPDYILQEGDSDSDESERGIKVWLAPEINKRLGTKDENRILPSAVFDEIAQHSQAQVNPAIGMELVPWVKPERVIEQTLLKSIQKKEEESLEEEPETGVDDGRTNEYEEMDI